MQNGELDSCHPAIVGVRFRNEANTNLENKVIDNNTNITNANGQHNFLVLILITKIIMGLGLGMLLCTTFLVMKRYRENSYQERDKSLQDTYSSSGGVFVEPNDDDLISWLSLELSKSLENAPSKPPSKIQSVRQEMISASFSQSDEEVDDDMSYSCTEAACIATNQSPIRQSQYTIRRKEALNHSDIEESNVGEVQNEVRRKKKNTVFIIFIQ